MRLAWLTDIHLNFVEPDFRRALLESLVQQCEAVVITGDIGESDNVADYLLEMEAILQRPIYFVLGNHDFYRSSIAATRKAITELAENSENLVYLTASGVIELSPTTALIGHDGWADARLGDFTNSNVLLNDYVLIKELQCWQGHRQLDKPKLRAALQRLGDEAAAQLEAKLKAAANDYSHVFAAMHVPPFREATWHEGKTSDDNWMPHFSCKAAGDALRKVMRSKPECQLQVLCGHTHGGGEIQPLPNLKVLTGPANYGAPHIQRFFEIA